MIVPQESNEYVKNFSLIPTARKAFDISVGGDVNKCGLGENLNRVHASQLLADCSKAWRRNATGDEWPLTQGLVHEYNVREGDTADVRFQYWETDYICAPLLQKVCMLMQPTLRHVHCM